MKPSITLLTYFILVAFITAQEIKPSDKYLTTKTVILEEVTVEDAIKKVLKQVNYPYAVILSPKDEKLNKAFKETKVTFSFNAGIPYDELVRHICNSAGFNVKREGVSWLITSLEDLQADDEGLWSQSYRINNQEAKALGLLDRTGEYDKEAMNLWLKEKAGESGIYSVERGILVVRSYKDKRDSISSLLKLYRQGYKTPTLYSQPKQ